MPDHLQQFADFCRWDRAAGGPDPHMACVGQICKQQNFTPAQTLWLGALYCAVYNVPTALVLLAKWPTAEAAYADEERTIWLAENWAGIAFRRERKAVRSAIKLGRCIESVAMWCLDAQSTTEAWDLSPGADERYELAFDDVTKNIYGFGRYIGQKFLEYGRRYCAWNVQVQDIRADDGWSPREGLALLMPGYSHMLTSEKNDALTLESINALADMLREDVLKKHQLTLDYYELQVFLCDYKQSWTGKRQYPGRSQDSELDYFNKIKDHWGKPPGDATLLFQPMFKARVAIFPHKALGEINGWHGVRKKLGKVLSTNGYTWSDLVYSWHRSKDLSKPVKHE